MPEHNSTTSAAAPSFTTLADLASARVGGRAIAANDDFFAAKSNLVKPEAPIFIPEKYTTRGKWMDGWESRRRRTPGHDWCVVRLGMRGMIRGVNVNTRFFTGNFPSHCAIDALDASRPLPARVYAADGAPWKNILPKSALRGDTDNFFAIASDQPWTHLRLNIFPDGGVARLRVYGDVVVDWRPFARSGRAVDLAAITNGGLAVAASDVHYGNPNEMLMPGRAKNMSDGWETKRRRGEGYDWAVIRLGATGVIDKIEIDTNHYKGNYPDRASLEGQRGDGTWVEILPAAKLRAHHRHFFSRELRRSSPVSHVRLNIYPDGGISRLRVYGRVRGEPGGRGTRLTRGEPETTELDQ
jgi:allantoicase